MPEARAAAPPADTRRTSAGSGRNGLRPCGVSTGGVPRCARLRRPRIGQPVRITPTANSLTQSTDPLAARLGPIAQPSRSIAGARLLLLAPLGSETSALADELARDDVEVVVAPSADAARARLRRQPPAIILLRAELETGTGYRVLNWLRGVDLVAPDCPAIAFSERAEPLDRMRALERGCVDFLATPIYHPELVARLGIAIGRARANQTVLRVAGGLAIDSVAKIATQHGQPLDLARLEFELLTLLASDPRRVWFKPELLRIVWGIEAPIRTRTLDGHACRLRSKLRDAGGSYVHNVWGKGYRLL